MKVKQIPITTGAACGTLVTRVESNSGKLLGFIRVVNIDWTPVLCMGTYFAVQQCFGHYHTKMVGTLADAYKFLGVSLEELDKSDLGDYPYDEKIPSNYWRARREEEEFLYDADGNKIAYVGPQNW